MFGNSAHGTGGRSFRGWLANKLVPDTKSLANPTDEEFAIFTGQVAGAGSVTVSQALRVPAVTAAIRTISEAAATLDLRVVRKEGAKETNEPNHPVAKLLNGDVNGWTSSFELTRDLVAQALMYDGGGLAYVGWASEKPVEIIHYRQGVITVDLTADTGEPVYRMGERQISSGSIIHVRGPFTQAPLSLAREALGFAVTLSDHGRNFFSNGARPSGVVGTKKSLGLDGLRRFRKAFKEQFAGSSKSGEPIVLDEEQVWKPFELSSADSQYLELRRYQVEEIARAFNIPVPMLGDLTRATWSNLESKNREFLSYCLEPWLRAVEAAYTRALFTEDERKTYAVRIDRDDLTRVSLTERATAIASLRASETITANEGRGWLDLPQSDDAGADTLANPNITVTTRTTDRAAQESADG